MLLLVKLEADTLRSTNFICIGIFLIVPITYNYKVGLFLHFLEMRFVEMLGNRLKDRIFFNSFEGGIFVKFSV